MKKLLFGLIATVTFGSMSYAQKTGDNPAGHVPVIELVFGRASQNCHGFGICRFHINLNADNLSTIATVIANPEQFMTLFMKPDFYKANASKFQNGYLVIEEDFVLDHETSRTIGLPDNYTVRKGKYQIIFDKTTNTYNCTF